MGKSAILQHLKQDKHKKAVDVSASAPMSTFFRREQFGESERKLAAAEGTFTYHTVRHSMSFRSMDCSTSLIQTLFEPKFTCRRTKCEAIALNVLAPFAMNELKEHLDLADFVSVYFDASNHKSTKVVPILVGYYSSTEGLLVRVLDVQEVQGETSDILTNYIFDTLRAHGLCEKVVSVSADNTNTNFGGAARKGSCNVFRKLETELGRSLIGAGCSTHILNSAIRNACDGLPIDIESVLMKIYGYFQHHTVRVEKFRTFCDNADVEYRQILGYCATRWLSLLPSIERVLQLFEPLRDFFLSEQKCSKVLLDFFRNENAEAWLYFIHSQASMFHSNILRLEATDVTIVDAAICLSDLHASISNMKDANFIPAVVRCKLRVEADIFRDHCVSFYQQCMAYLDKWCKHFRDVESLKWISLRSCPSWDDVEVSLQLLSRWKVAVNDVQLIEEVRRVGFFVTATKLKVWKEQEASTPSRWTEVLTHLRHNDIPHSQVTKIVSFVLCIPGTNAAVERIFSLMNNLWTSEKTQLSIKTLKALLTVKANFNHTCSEFHELILSKNHLLQSIHSSSKY